MSATENGVVLDGWSEHRSVTMSPRGYLFRPAERSDVGTLEPAAYLPLDEGSEYRVTVGWYCDFGDAEGIMAVRCTGENRIRHFRTLAEAKAFVEGGR